MLIFSGCSYTSITNKLLKISYLLLTETNAAILLEVAAPVNWKASDPPTQPHALLLLGSHVKHRSTIAQTDSEENERIGSVKAYY